MDADAWLFIKWVCGHGADDIQRFHRPLAYFLAGDAVRLAASLDKYDSAVCDAIRAELTRRKIDYHTKAGLRSLARLLRRVNNRISRSMGKTSIGLDVLLWKGSVDPNLNIGIASKSDPAAWAMCETIGNIMRSDAYKTYYPDRLFPSDTDSYITQKWIQMRGRTNPNQKTIEARGINSQWYSKHYHIIYGDDLSSTEAKQGEATVEDAARFLASLRGISMSERWGGTRLVMNGTIQGAKDDNAILVADPSVISIRIPIWKKDVPSNVKNIPVDGIPVLPELYDVDAIRQMRAETIGNPLFGAIAWLQNFELTAHEEGAMQFTQELLKRSKFMWIPKEIGRRPSGEPVYRNFIRRYLFNGDKPLLDDKRKGGDGKCSCYLDCGQANHKFKEIDPLTLTRVLAVDQAFSVGAHANRWAVVPACGPDADGVVYALKCEADKGYQKMVPAIPVVFNRWGGAGNPPRKVGIDSAAMQGTTADWMKRDEAFRFLARRLESIKGSGVAKDVRIFNNVLANMEMGTLMVDPEDVGMHSEMLRWNPNDENPEDDRIDALSMAVTLLATRTEQEDEREIQRAAIEREAEYKATHDDYTGIDVSTDYMEAMW